ncbi:hypothetical protein CCHR01_17954 [Colletotrichum chrysophilum]|uniref:Uncharacterized protein n=1 Tax=Colletotrichum chrysophilum TaxID=1836956 RepID=A0AAD9E6F3_9PEZI|nr:hypothetical protein CCHR01_17954 [Colletotrichum chrysophilum]
MIGDPGESAREIMKWRAKFQQTEGKRPGPPSKSRLSLLIEEVEEVEEAARGVGGIKGSTPHTEVSSQAPPIRSLGRPCPHVSPTGSPLRAQSLVPVSRRFRPLHSQPLQALLPPFSSRSASPHHPTNAAPPNTHPPPAPAPSIHSGSGLGPVLS